MEKNHCKNKNNTRDLKKINKQVFLVDFLERKGILANEKPYMGLYHSVFYDSNEAFLLFTSSLYISSQNLTNYVSKRPDNLCMSCQDKSQQTLDWFQVSKFHV